MGYSCSTKASFVYDAILQFQEFDIDNKENYKYFLEIGRENRDGSITGKVYKMLCKVEGKQYCKKIGNFKIANTGEIIRFPGLSKNLWGVAEIAAIEKYDKEFNFFIFTQVA